MVLHTGIYAALCGSMLIGLAAHVIRARRKQMMAMGQGDFELQRRIRAHGNFAEYAPMFLIMLGFSELQGLHPLAVHGFGVVFMAGRGMHAYSLLKAEQYVDGKITAFPHWRRRGMVCCFGCIGLLALTLLAQAFISPEI